MAAVLDDGVDVTPGEATAITVGLGPTGYRFEPGMSLRLQLTCSAFPHLARNLNTGGSIAQEAQAVVAHTDVLHDLDHASYVVVPVQTQPSLAVFPPIEI